MYIIENDTESMQVEFRNKVYQCKSKTDYVRLCNVLSSFTGLSLYRVSEYLQGVIQSHTERFKYELNTIAALDQRVFEIDLQD